MIQPTLRGPVTLKTRSCYSDSELNRQGRERETLYLFCRWPWDEDLARPPLDEASVLSFPFCSLAFLVLPILSPPPPLPFLCPVSTFSLFLFVFVFSFFFVLFSSLFFFSSPAIIDFLCIYRDPPSLPQPTLTPSRQHFLFFLCRSFPLFPEEEDEESGNVKRHHFGLRVILQFAS